MEDPTRIPRLLASLQDLWEGQPDLTLGQLIAVLQHHGVSWSTPDEEAAAVIDGLLYEHPALIDDTAGPISATTIAPEQLVTLVDGFVVVRSASAPGRMPSVWRASSLRKTGPGLPLVITDEGGVEHRLGVVSLLSRFKVSNALSGLTRGELGASRWCVLFDDGSRAVVGQRIRVWSQHRRSVDEAKYAWERILACEPGKDMKIAPPSGAAPVTVGRVERVLPLEGADSR